MTGRRTLLVLLTGLLSSSLFANDETVDARKLLLQPFLIHYKCPPSLSGKAFIITSQDERQFIATSATYFFRGEFPVTQVQWFDLLGEKNLGTSSGTWGEPGNPPAFDPVDFQFNFMLFRIAELPEGFHPLELDERQLPREGEVVWFPKMNPESPTGYDRVKGVINEANQKYLDVILDEEIGVRGQSGCPLISEETGRVVGIFYGGIPMAGITKAFFSPAYEVFRQVDESKAEIPLGPSRTTLDRSG
jgi:hypothetical protein